MKTYNTGTVRIAAERFIESERAQLNRTLFMIALDECKKLENKNTWWKKVFFPSKLVNVPLAQDLVDEWVMNYRRDEREKIPSYVQFILNDYIDHPEYATINRLTMISHKQDATNIQIDESIAVLLGLNNED